MTGDKLVPLAAMIGARLKALGYKLATAESCTGGWVAETVTSVPGSSGWFDRGFVTYSNESKSELLGVRPETLSRYGAVSEQTAREMAAGALERSHAQVAIAITGVAGPDGGTREKPVGTVCLAWVFRPGAPESTSCRFGGDRESVRRQSVVTALQGLLDRVEK